MAHLSLMKTFGLVTSLISMIFLSSCGGSSSARKSGKKTSQVEKLFRSAAKKHKIPLRMMLATAYVESNINPKKSSALYENPKTGAYDYLRGVRLGETAFGLTLKQLNLADDGASESLEAQVDAYGAWLAKSVFERANLVSSPKSSEEKFNWIWEIAQAHRPGSSYSRNVQVLLAKELMAALNYGFTWQDPESGEVLEFKKERPPLQTEDLGADAVSILTLTHLKPEIDSATYLRLGVPHTGEVENKPKRVEVVHCPFALSACLELQKNPEDDAIKMESHYVIPQNDELIPYALQINRHSTPVRLTTPHGDFRTVTDAIVVMLVGNSGRVVDGYRESVQPTWFSKWQMQQLGNVVYDICLSLEQKQEVNFETCRTVGKGTQFHSQGTSENFRWGDIADFDPLIFSAYIEKPGGLSSETVIEFPKTNPEFRSGDMVRFKLKFQPQVKHIELERLVRCPDRKLVWASISSDDVRNKSTKAYEKRFFDSGANGSGNQFLRAKVYGPNGELYGYDVAEFFVKNFEVVEEPVTPRACYN